MTIRYQTIRALAYSLLTAVAHAQPSSAPDHFPSAALMQVGVYYYPEAWPHHQWERDISNIKKLDMEFVHMGEFAWAFMEPEEGKFDFDWLDRNIQLCAEQGLKVILCTPSPTPPVWLTQKSPEVLMVDAKGRTMQHGTRQHACWNVDTYREYVSKIIHELGKRYGKDSRVWGWQLDNELSHYGKEPCFCDTCQKQFRIWLEKKYGTIDKLNQDWGCAFWSQMYQNFDQIRIPNKEEVVAQQNEHSILDAQRWFAESAAEYLRFQTEILRHYCGNQQWITHNFMHAFDRTDPILNAEDFDIVTWTIYPAHGNLNEGPLGFRMGSAATLSFANDFFRNLNGTHAIMELQPGQVNWGEVSPQPYPGAIRLWMMRSFAAGSKFVCTYRYRQPLSGAEQYHAGIVGTDGVTPSSGGQQYAQVAREMVLLRKHRNPDAREPAAYSARRTALLYNFENRWDIENHKQNIRWDTTSHILKTYRALKAMGCPVDVITEDKPFDKYPFLVAPAYQLVDENLAQRWKSYAENGGHLLLTCRTGIKDRRGHLWEGPWAAPILDLIGGRIAFYDTLPAPHHGMIKIGDETHSWFTWSEVLEPGNDTRILARHADQFYKDQPAAITRKLGKGSVTYVGVDSENGNLEKKLLRGLFEQANVAVENFAEGFIVDWQEGFWVATNFNEHPHAAPIPENVQPLIGEKMVPTAGVTIWQE